ncbi:MAG: hypothetical protein RLZZ299_1411 [Pseudomonadota bacterium]|jgi:predicted  nucleic acid-binding Zn-ribbon protein
MSHPSDSGRGLPPALTHVAAILLGALLGVGGSSLAEYLEDPEAMSRPEAQLSKAKLVKRLVATEQKRVGLEADLAARSEEIAKANSELDAAGQKVQTLETKVQDTEQEVKILELKVQRSQGKSAALQRELEAKQAELEDLRGQLTVALEEKAQLEQDLEVSRSETREARDATQAANRETDRAKRETVEALWEGFRAQATNEICVKGSRSKMEKCREDVDAALDGKRRARYKQCIATGQATPRLLQVDTKQKDAGLPRWSEWFDEENKLTRQKWFIVFCDPTLPEARGERAAVPRRADPLDDLPEDRAAPSDRFAPEERVEPEERPAKPAAKPARAPARDPLLDADDDF